MLFKNNNGKAEKIEEISFNKEKEIKKFCEDNLEMIMNLKFIKTEYWINGTDKSDFRYDTLAYDETNNSFVIIEYKNGKDYSVIDQGIAYLSTLINHQDKVVYNYNEIFNENKKIEDFDWSQSKVMIISTTFNEYQRAVNLYDLPIELWRIRKYKEGLNEFIELEQIPKIKQKKSIRNLIYYKSSNKNKMDDAKDKNDSDNLELKAYTENGLISNANTTEKLIDIYNELKECILSYNEDISVNINKYYINFIKDRKVLISIRPQKNSLKFYLNCNIENIRDDDPKEIIKENYKGHLGVGDSEITIENETDIEYIKYIINKYLDRKLYSIENNSS